MSRQSFSRLSLSTALACIALIASACGGKAPDVAAAGDTTVNPLMMKKDASGVAVEKDASADGGGETSVSDASISDASDAAKDVIASLDATLVCPPPGADGAPACGAGCTATCPIGHSCRTGDDCDSLACIQQMCSAPSCVDAVKNGTETDLNCGGTCPPCPDLKSCKVNTDCASLICGPVDHTCQKPTCSDGVKNGTEADIDCGGTCAKLCAAGQMCKTGGDCRSGICPNSNRCACPTGMTTIPIPGSGTYCIDSIEVTYAAYKLFINSNPNIGTQPAYCTWNTTYVPSAGWPRPVLEETLPVTSIDWCDAYAFCKENNKHLCGKMGGGADAYSGFATATTNEWYNACSAQGVNVYPYADTYNASKCNGENQNAAATVSSITCLGGLPGLYDMSGNVWEWEDSCAASTGSDDECRVRGGSFQSSPDLLKCAADSTTIPMASIDGGTNDASASDGSTGDANNGDAAGRTIIRRNTTAPDVGFRCCQ